MKLRRGGTLALVLCLFLALGSVLMGAVALAAASNAAAERDYRRSQALALAEAGIAEAEAGLPPHTDRPLGVGSYGWSSQTSGGELRVTGWGSVTSASGAAVTRKVRVALVRAGSGWSVRAREDGP